METYIFTLWVMWPSAQDSTIIQWLVTTARDCQRLALWYAAILRADGADSIAWSCVQQVVI